MKSFEVAIRSPSFYAYKCNTTAGYLMHYRKGLCFNTFSKSAKLIIKKIFFTYWLLEQDSVFLANFAYYWEVLVIILTEKNTLTYVILGFPGGSDS